MVLASPAPACPLFGNLPRHALDKPLHRQKLFVGRPLPGCDDDLAVLDDHEYHADLVSFQNNQPIGRSALWILTAQLGQFLGMLAFGYLARRYGRRLLFTMFSLLTAAALYPLAFHWQALLPHPLLFWSTLFALGLGSGCTAGCLPTSYFASGSAGFPYIGWHAASDNTQSTVDRWPIVKA